MRKLTLLFVAALAALGAVAMAASLGSGSSHREAPLTSIRFDDRADYYINIDNTGDGKPDVRYKFDFTTRFRRPGSFLYALPGVSSVNDQKLNLVQTYNVTREIYKNGHEVSHRFVATKLPTAPNNVGPKTIPDYAKVAAGAIRSLPGGGKVFAGQVDDPFFVDLGTRWRGGGCRA